MELERVKANEIWNKWKNLEVGCMHGCDTSIADDHPVSKFMDEFFIHWIRKHKNIALILQDMLQLQRYSHVWTEDNHRELAIQTLVSIGANMLLADDDINEGSLSMAKTILVLEHYDSSEGLSLHSPFYGHSSAVKRRDMDPDVSSTKRDLLKFYRKRLPCKCLKRMHLEARKTTPKMGMCNHCNIEKERVTLSVCSRCMVHQYCSKECQVAAWPEHDKECKIYYSYDQFQQQKNQVEQANES